MNYTKTLSWRSLYVGGSMLKQKISQLFDGLKHCKSFVFTWKLSMVRFILTWEGINYKVISWNPFIVKANFLPFFSFSFIKVKSSWKKDVLQFQPLDDDAFIILLYTFDWYTAKQVLYLTFTTFFSTLCLVLLQQITQVFFCTYIPQNNSYPPMLATGWGSISLTKVSYCKWASHIQDSCHTSDV